MKAIKTQIIPNVEQLARELTGKSQVQVVIDKFKTLSLVSKIIFVTNNLVFLPKLLKKDFATGIKLLCELEILKTRKKAYTLHHQMVDMAIALKNKSIIEYFFYLARKYNFEASLVTYNPKPLIKYLSYFKKLPNLKIYTSPQNLDEKNILNFAKFSKLLFVSLKDD